VLATAETKDLAEDAFNWSFAGKRKLKGVKGEQPLFRARLIDSSE
jgi:class 3 adenylate cyclase